MACHACGYIRCDCNERVLLEYRDYGGFRVRWRPPGEDW